MRLTPRRTEISCISQADLAGARFNGDDNSFIGTEMHVESLRTTYSISTLCTT
jgi:hypothetical protein